MARRCLMDVIDMVREIYTTKQSDRQEFRQLCRTLIIKFPTDCRKAQTIKEGFLEFRFPNILWCVDASFIHFNAPSWSSREDMSVCRNGIYVLNVQGIFDSHKKKVKYLNLAHDAFLWSQCSVQIFFMLPLLSFN